MSFFYAVKRNYVTLAFCGTLYKTDMNEKKTKKKTMLLVKYLHL